MSGAQAIGGRHPSAAEWKVLCAVAQESLHLALRNRAHHVTFQGYRIEACRAGSEGEAGDVIEIRVSDAGHHCPSNCECIEVARYLVLRSACLMQWLPVSRAITVLH